FYKQHRELLLGGDMVRMDEVDDRVMVHGVVSPDQSRAIFAHVVLDSPRSSPGPRLRFRGLDPARRYVVRPAIGGTPPSGLVPPEWWGEPDVTGRNHPGVLM